MALNPDIAVSKIPKGTENPPIVSCPACGFKGHYLYNHVRTHGSLAQMKATHGEFPLFSSRYSGKRTQLGLRESPKQKFLSASQTLPNNLRKQALLDLELAGYVTTGVAAAITGLSDATFQKAIRREQLPSGKVELIGLIDNKIRRLGGPPISLIIVSDLESFLHNISRRYFREKALDGLAMYKEIMQL